MQLGVDRDAADVGIVAGTATDAAHSQPESAGRTSTSTGRTHSDADADAAAENAQSRPSPDTQTKSASTSTCTRIHACASIAAGLTRLLRTNVEIIAHCTMLLKMVPKEPCLTLDPT